MSIYMPAARASSPEVKIGALVGSQLYDLCYAFWPVPAHVDGYITAEWLVHWPLFWVAKGSSEFLCGMTRFRKHAPSQNHAPSKLLITGIYPAASARSDMSLYLSIQTDIPALLWVDLC